MEESCHIACSKNIRGRGQQVLVDDDSIIHLQSSLLCEFKVWTDPNSRYDTIDLERATGSCANNGAIPGLFKAGYDITGNDFYSLSAIEVIQELGKIRGIDIGTNRFFRKNHDDFLPD